jgi:hypothetical protein
MRFFGAKDLPNDVRAIGRYLGARTLSEITRHRFGNDDCSFAWIGPVRYSDFNSQDACLDCGTSRYKITSAHLLEPRSTFYYFGATNALQALHRNLVMQTNWKIGLDDTLNAYRNSPDAERLDRATFGKALTPENGLYISMANGFQSHKSST